MSVQIQTKEITNQQEWDRFLLTLQPNTFLQSWVWGQLQQQSGEDVHYVAFFKNEIQIGAALIIVVNAKRGRHLLIPHGPIFATEKETIKYLPDVIDYCKEIAQKKSAVAIRIAPLLVTTPENQAAFKQYGFYSAPLHVHTELTWMLNIDKPEQELFAGMRKTTRHAIRKCLASDIGVDVITNPEAIKRFLPLYKTTKQRHGFVPFSEEFLTNQVTLFSKNGNMYMCFAHQKGKDIAGGLFIHLGHTVFYHHGASLFTPLPASQLLQWTSIQEAKRRGAKRYNFWGIAPASAKATAGKPAHPFAGITVFKKGFGGYAMDYMHAQDLPLSFLYWQLWLIDSYRKWKRGF
jgi:lipid II:glycine glycyltransferase (peptidoglycan interpeptide bridge formation enzyme)